MEDIEEHAQKTKGKISYVHGLGELDITQSSLQIQCNFHQN
jgi:hypothetical protein